MEGRYERRRKPRRASEVGPFMVALQLNRLQRNVLDDEDSGIIGEIKEGPGRITLWAFSFLGNSLPGDRNFRDAIFRPINSNNVAAVVNDKEVSVANWFIHCRGPFNDLVRSSDALDLRPTFRPAVRL